MFAFNREKRGKYYISILKGPFLPDVSNFLIRVEVSTGILRYCLSLLNHGELLCINFTKENLLVNRCEQRGEEAGVSQGIVSAISLSLN